MKCNVDILEGKHKLTGVGTTFLEEGYILEIDGKLYIVYEQEDDECRSSCAIQLMDEDQVSSNLTVMGFPEQDVEISVGETYDNSYIEGVEFESFKIFNPYDKSVIFDAWTNAWRDWYPCAQFAYYPENLPINK